MKTKMLKNTTLIKKNDIQLKETKNIQNEWIEIWIKQ
jgi:hypothetical protein